MSVLTYNPYKSVAQLFTNGMAAIIATPLTPASTVDDLVNAVAAYIEATFFVAPTAQVKIEIASVCYTAINNYINGLVPSGKMLYDMKQAPFIRMLLGLTINLQPDAIDARLVNIENNIPVSELDVMQQNPLFLATLLGTTANDYWLAQISGPSPWVAFFSANLAINTSNVPYWTDGAINGTLSSYGATFKGLIEPTINIVSTNIISALAGAITVTAAKLMFDITPKITKPLF